MFSALKVEKDRYCNSGQDYDSVEEMSWRDFLDKGAIEWFDNTFDYDSEEGRTYLQLWELTAPEIRLSHPMFIAPGNWDFDSMIEMLFVSDYTLIDLLEEPDGKGVLFYHPHAFPFGSVEAMVELVESFGHTATFDSFNNSHPHRSVSGWDFDLAKQLVATGKGFTPSETGTM